LASRHAGTSSQTMRTQVVEARQLQYDRFRRARNRTNAQMSTRQIREHCKLDTACQELLKSSVTEMGLSARAHDKILRVTRTIADLEQSDTIRYEHLSEAINFRLLDRKLWT